MKTILFDLDGTLLPMNTEKFMHLYKSAITEAFSDFEGHETLFEKIMASVSHTVRNTSEIYNETKFFDHFRSQVSGSMSAYKATFEHFYETGFDLVKDSTSQSSHIQEAIKVLKDKGYRLIIATNPIFPMRANEKRIEWAGLDIQDFDYVSSFEGNKYCKPHPEFFHEVLRANNLNADEVLMVGNDAQEDMAIKKLGAQTYMITECLIDRDGSLDLSDFSGTYGDFLEFAKSLERLV